MADQNQDQQARTPRPIPGAQKAQGAQPPQGKVVLKAPPAKPQATAPQPPKTPPTPPAAQPQAAAPAPTPASTDKTLFSQQVTLDQVMKDLLARLEVGQTVTISKTSKDELIIQSGVPQVFSNNGHAVKKNKAPSGKDAEQFMTDEYLSWLNQDAGGGKAWKDMTPEEKGAMAQELGASWEQAADPRINLMRMVNGVLAALGISKWKPGYEDTAARIAAMGR